MVSVAPGLSIKLLLLVAVLIVFGGPLVQGARPANSDLLPRLQNLAKAPFLGRVLNGPRIPEAAHINRVQIKILQIEEARPARDRTAWHTTPEYKVWPIRVHVIVNYTASGSKAASSGEGICYAYRDSQDNWAVTAFPPEIKKPPLDRIWDSILGSGRGT